MNDSLQYLFELQTLEFEEMEQSNPEQRIAALRAKIPKPMLSHYDRFLTRGKKGLALVRNQVCTGCHMSVPLGVVVQLKHGGEVRLCDNCRRYLYLGKEVAATSPAATKIPAKTSSRKELAHAA